MIKYKEHEIDISMTNYSDGVAILPLPDGTMTCLPEEGATESELEIIQQIREDVEKRIVGKVVPTKEELKAKYDRLSEQYIHEKYSYDDENKIMREYLLDKTNKDYKTTFEAYNSYVNECKKRANNEVYGNEVS